MPVMFYWLVFSQTWGYKTNLDGDWMRSAHWLALFETTEQIVFRNKDIFDIVYSCCQKCLLSISPGSEKLQTLVPVWQRVWCCHVALGIVFSSQYFCIKTSEFEIWYQSMLSIEVEECLENLCKLRFSYSR